MLSITYNIDIANKKQLCAITKLILALVIPFRKRDNTYALLGRNTGGLF